MAATGARSRYRFSVEKGPGGRFVIVDWRLGILLAPGIGTWEDAEKALLQIRAYLKKNDDVNITRLPQNRRTPPGWRPKERPGWLAEQRAISRAYANLGDIIRRHKLSGEALASSPDLRLAKKYADELLGAALRDVGLTLD